MYRKWTETDLCVPEVTETDLCVPEVDWDWPVCMRRCAFKCDSTLVVKPQTSQRNLRFKWISKCCAKCALAANFFPQVLQTKSFCPKIEENRGVFYLFVLCNFFKYFFSFCNMRPTAASKKVSFYFSEWKTRNKTMVLSLRLSVSWLVGWIWNKMRGFSIKVERHFFKQGRMDKGPEVRYHVTGCVNSVSADCQSLWEFGWF